MINDIWRQRVATQLVALKNGGLPITNDVLRELVGPDHYDQFWEALFDAEDEDQARYEEVKRVGLPKTLNGYLSNRAWAQKALADRRKLEKRHALAIARKQALIDDLVRSCRKGYAALSDEDKAYLAPVNPNAQGEPAEGLPDKLPGHLVGDPYRPQAKVRAQIAVLEAALARAAQQP